jgi:hypothetical protein
MGGCFEWIGCRDKDGYGKIYINQKHTRAHRASWFINTGKWPYPDTFVLHKCDNPSCVRFDHLFLGTASDNSQDCSKKGRYINRGGERHSTAKLMESDIIFIRNNVRSFGTQGDLANKLGVSQATISNIVNGKRWAHAAHTFAE